MSDDKELSKKFSELYQVICYIDTTSHAKVLKMKNTQNEASLIFIIYIYINIYIENIRK